MKSIDLLATTEDDKLWPDQGADIDVSAFAPAAKDAEIQTNFDLSDDTPEQAALYGDLSKRTGLPIGVVRQEPKRVQKLAERPDTFGMTSGWPSTAEYLSKIDSAAVSKRDIEPLKAIEDWYKRNEVSWERNVASFSELAESRDNPIGRTKASLKVGTETVVGGKLGSAWINKVLTGTLDPDDNLEKEIADFEASRTEPVDTQGVVEYGVHNALQMLPLMLDTTRESIVQGAYGLVTGAAIGSMVPGVGTATGGLTGFAVASRAGAVKQTFIQESGNAALEFRQIRDENGNPIDPEIIAISASLVGAVNAPLEFIGLSSIGNFLVPGMKKATQALIRGRVRAVLSTAVGREALKNLAKKYGEMVLTEGTTEFLQEGMTILGGEGAKKAAEVTAGGEFPSTDPWEALTRMMDAGLAGGSAALVLGTVGSVTRAGVYGATTTQRDAARAKEFRQRMAEIAELVESSETKHLSPEHAERHLDLIGLGDEVFIDGEQLFQMSQEEGGQELMNKLGIDSKTVEQRREAGQAVGVKASTVLTKLSIEEQMKLGDHVKAAPGAMSAAEAAAVDEGKANEEATAITEEVIARENEYRAEMDRYKKEVAEIEGGEYAEHLMAIVDAFATRMGIEGVDKVAFAKKLKINNMQTIRRIRESVSKSEFNQDGERDTSHLNFRRWSAGAPVVEDIENHTFKEGQPVVVKGFHGTVADIKEIDLNQGDIGFHFGTPMHANIRLRDKFFSAKAAAEGGGNVMPMYVRMTNPLKATDTQWNDSEAVAGMLSLSHVPNISERATDIMERATKTRESKKDISIPGWFRDPDNKALLAEIREMLIDEGYDSVIYDNEGEFVAAPGDKMTSDGFRQALPSFIALSPSQVKSVFNRGPWSEGSDLLYDSFKPPKREKKTGRYVGAPDWIGNNPRKLTALRKKLKQLATEGEPGRYWYENSSDAILRLAGGDIAEAERIVALIAIYSPNATVPANTTMALTAYYQWKNGQEIKAGLGSGNKKATDLLVNGEMWSGVKTNSFYQNLMVNIDPSKLDPGVATMDMWMAIAFDYGFKSLDQGPKYAFSQNEIVRLAEEIGWEPHQVQAAIWTAMKSRVDPIRAQLKEKELKKGIGELYEKDGKTLYRVKADKKYDHYRLAHKMGMAYKVSNKDTDAAKYDFSNALEERMAQMSWEATPSTSVDDVSFIHSAPTEIKFKYLEGIQGVLTDKDGNDVIANLIGLPSPPSINGYSAWEGDVGAGAQDFISVPLEGSGKNRAVKQDAAELLNLYAAVRGYVLRQDAVVWHVPVYDDAKIRHNGFEIRSTRPISEEEMKQLYSAIHEEFGTWELAPGYIENGLRILNFVEDLENKDFQARMKKVFKSLPDSFGGGNLTNASYRSDGDYIFNDWTESPDGKTYRDRIEAGRPDLLGRVEDVRARVEAFNKRFETEAATLYQSDGKSGGGLRAGDLEVVQQYGTPTENSEQIRGVHYSQAARESLSGEFYGRGMKGAESKRLEQSEDDRLRKRIHFYVDTGNGITPESAVGRKTHAVDLSNMYDIIADPLGLVKKAQEQTEYWKNPYNTMESLIIDLGFDGYFNSKAQPNQGVAVLLGDHNVKVDHLGQHDTLLENQSTLLQDDTEVIRGSIPLSNDSHVISIFQDKRIDTILHETGHIFLKELDALMRTGTASERMQKDFDTILKWLGADSVENITREQHEQFANGMRDYIGEGKAPSQELRAAFSRFKQWLKQLFGRATQLNTRTTPEVRAVFGRLFTAQQEVLVSAQENGIAPWSDKLMDVLGVIPADRKYIARLHEEAMAEAEDLMMHDRNFRSNNRKGKWAKEAEREVNEDPTQAALQGAKRLKLNSQQIGNRNLRNILNEKGLTKERGEDIEASAALYGFASGAELVQALAAANTREEQKQLIINEKQQAYDAQFRADSYIAQTKAYDQILQIRARYLERAAGKPSGVSPSKTLKIAAERQFSKLTLEVALRSDWFLGAIKRHTQGEKQAIQKGDFAGASRHNEQVRLNHEMARLAGALRKRRDVMVRRAKSIGSRDPGKTLPDFRNGLHDLINRFEMRGKGKFLDVEPGFNFAALLEGVSANNPTEVRQGFYASPQLLGMMMPLTKLTVDTFYELQDLMKYLEIHGRPDGEKLTRDGRKVVEVQAEMAAESEALPKRKVPAQLGTADRMISDAWDGFWARSDSMNFTMIAMGGYQSVGKDGTFSMSEMETTQALSDAHGVKSKKVKERTAQLMPHYTQILNTMLRLKKEYGQFLQSDDLPPVPAILAKDGAKFWTPQMVFSLALHYGNESNRSRIFSGFPDLTDGHLKQLFDLLTEADWDAVQGIWDLNDQIFDEVNEVHHRVNGYYVKKIPASPFFVVAKREDGTTIKKQVKGGYSPVRYDAGLMHRVTNAGANRINSFYEQEDLLARHESKFMTPSVKSNFTKARVDKTPYPLLLNLDMVGSHIMDALHYVAYEEVVRDVNNIFKGQEFQEAVVGTLGPEVLTQLREQLAYVANPRKQSVDPQMEGWLGRLRAGTTAWMLAYNTSVAAKQGLSAPAAAQYIGNRGLVAAYVKHGMNIPEIKNNILFMLNNSEYMSSRTQSFDQEFKKMFSTLSFDGVMDASDLKDLKTLIKTIGSPTGKSVKVGSKVFTWDDVADIGFFPIKAIDMATVMPIWTEAYQQKMNQGHSHDEAVRHADEAIRATQPSAQSIDMTKWQRDGGVASLLSMFGTFTVGKYQQRLRLNWRMMRAGVTTKAQYAQTALLEQLIPAVAAQAIVTALKGGDLDDDDDKAAFLARVIGQMVSMPVPVVGNILFPLGSFLFDLPVLTPIQSFQRSLVAGGKEIYKGEWLDAAADFAMAAGHAWSVANRVPITRVIQKTDRILNED